MKRALLMAWVVALSASIASAQSLRGQCFQGVVAQVKLAKEVSQACFDQLQADIESGTPITPETIAFRTAQCESFDVTPDERRAWMAECTDLYRE